MKTVEKIIMIANGMPTYKLQKQFRIDLNVILFDYDSEVRKDERQIIADKVKLIDLDDTISSETLYNLILG